MNYGFFFILSNNFFLSFYAKHIHNLVFDIVDFRNSKKIP